MLNFAIYFILSGIVFAYPLIIAGMGSVVNERTGVMNLGVEGMMLNGAFFSFAGAVLTGNAIFGICFGVLSAMIFGLIHAYSSVKLRTSQVVVAVALNMISLGLTSTLFTTLFSGTKIVVASGINPITQLVLGGGKLIPISPFLIIAILLIPSTWFIFNKTTWGLMIKAVGEYPEAASTNGVKVDRVRIIATVYGSLLAGLAGVALMLGDAKTFQDNFIAGRGFIVFACVVFGRFTPIGTAIGCVIFGLSTTLSNLIQVYQWPLPGGYVTALILPYAITLLLLIFSKQSASPKAWAVPYERVG